MGEVGAETERQNVCAHVCARMCVCVCACAHVCQCVCMLRELKLGPATYHIKIKREPRERGEGEREREMRACMHVCVPQSV